MDFGTCLEHRQEKSIECPICVIEERDQLRAEVERLRSEPERVLAYVYESLTKEPWDASRGPLTANCLWIEIGKWIDQARAENERLRAQIVETEATAEK